MKKYIILLLLIIPFFVGIGSAKAGWLATEIKNGREPLSEDECIASQDIFVWDGYKCYMVEKNKSDSLDICTPNLTLDRLEYATSTNDGRICFNGYFAYSTYPSRFFLFL